MDKVLIFLCGLGWGLILVLFIENVYLNGLFPYFAIKINKNKMGYLWKPIDVIARVSIGFVSFAGIILPNLLIDVFTSQSNEISLRINSPQKDAYTWGVILGGFIMLYLVVKRQKKNNAAGGLDKR
jgi:hypothetical protein